MKIALISPKGPLYRHKTGIFRKSLRAAPLTLTTLAALVPKELQADVALHDEGIEVLPESLDADLIGMTVITGTAPRAYQLAAQYRAAGKTVVLGGPHVTLAPDDAKPHADTIVTGYAEETWPALLRDYEYGELRAHYQMAPDFSLKKPENLVFAKRSLLKRKAYRTSHTFEATRGCVHQCDFCVVPAAWSGGPYQKPVEHVVEDIQQTRSKYVLFYDLNLIANRQYAESLFKALVPLRVKWFGLASTLLSTHMMDLMARSGCRGLLIGFENVLPNALDAVNKSFNRPSRYCELVSRLHDRGILINGTFMFGTDAENTDSFKCVEEFVMSAGIDLPRYSIVTPFPGTPLFRRLEKEGRILTMDWSQYDGQHVVYRPKCMSVEQLQEGHERVWKATYSVSGIVKRTAARLHDMFAAYPLVLTTNLGYRYYANNLSRFYTCMGGIA